MKKRSAKLSDTAIARREGIAAAALESQRLELTRELEKLMVKYSKLTGYKELRQRKYKVGAAPNDWHK